MKPVEKIGQLLKEPICTEWFEMHHQYKLLKIEIEKLQSKLRRSNNDKMVMEYHLNSTIEQLKTSNDKIKKLRRKELRENQRKILSEVSKLEQITSSMTSSMAFIDNEYKYRYINHKYTEWFGVKKEDILGKTISEAAGQTFFDFYKPLYDKILGGESFNTEIDTKIVDTSIRLVINSNYVPAYDLEGNNIGLYVYGTDVTENKRKEELLEVSKLEIKKTNDQLKKYIESNVQLEQFAFIAAHDMKAPLRSIASFSDLLERSLSDKLDEKQSDYFDYISTGTKRMSALITDLLNYSKVSGHKLNLEPTDLNQVVKNVTQYLASTIEERKAEVNISNPLPKNLVVDRVKIYQVFQNLIANAIKFTAPDVSPRVIIDYSKEQEFHKFLISDNGIGMEEEYHKQIFESFKQINNKSEFEGTGLGLSICKKIIEHHGGEISVESTMGEGTTMIFTLPFEVNNKKST